MSVVRGEGRPTPYRTDPSLPFSPRSSDLQRRGASPPRPLRPRPAATRPSPALKHPLHRKLIAIISHTCSRGPARRVRGVTGPGRAPGYKVSRRTPRHPTSSRKRRHLRLTSGRDVGKNGSGLLLGVPRSALSRSGGRILSGSRDLRNRRAVEWGEGLGAVPRGYDLLPYLPISPAFSQRAPQSSTSGRLPGDAASSFLQRDRRQRSPHPWSQSTARRDA